MKEEELLIGYMEEVEHELQNERQLLVEQQRVRTVIKNMIEDSATVVQRKSRYRRMPELRVLTKAPRAAPRRK